MVVECVVEDPRWEEGLVEAYEVPGGAGRYELRAAPGAYRFVSKGAERPERREMLPR